MRRTVFISYVSLQQTSSFFCFFIFKSFSLKSIFVCDAAVAVVRLSDDLISNEYVPIYVSGVSLLMFS